MNTDSAPYFNWMAFHDEKFIEAHLQAWGLDIWCVVTEEGMENETNAKRQFDVLS